MFTDCYWQVAHLSAFDGEYVLLLLLLIWTTFTCINYSRLQVQEICRTGAALFLRDPWSLMESVYIVCQLVRILIQTRWPTSLPLPSLRPAHYTLIGGASLAFDSRDCIARSS